MSKSIVYCILIDLFYNSIINGRYLFKWSTGENKVDRFKFVDPNGLGPYPGQKFQSDDISRRARNLSSRLLEMPPDQLLLVPCNVE